jgi:hypothetical protein
MDLLDFILLQNQISKLKNLITYEQFLLTEALDTSKISDIKKIVSEKLRTEVEYTESSGVFKCVGLALKYPEVLEEILKKEGYETKNIKLVGAEFSGDTEFEIK